MRLIDADALIVSKDWVNCTCPAQVIHKAPTIEAEPVRHASWKYYHKKGIAVCTDCSFERNLDDNFGHAVSCPNCGAKMDGGEKE